MRIVLELKRDAVEDVVLNQLYHHTQMEQTFGVINLALVDGQPRVLSLKEGLQSYVDYRITIIRRRTEYDLRKARDRAHIVEGLITAVDYLEEIILPIPIHLVTPSALACIRDRSSADNLT